MVNRLPQSEFEAAKFDSGRFNLHQHVTDGASAPTSTLVVFVHGFCGRGYETWGQLPKLLFGGAGSLMTDVGIFDYRSGYRAVARRTGKPEFWLKQLAGHLREVQADYSDIVLVGHSLGGLLIEAVAKVCLEERALRDDEGPPAFAALIVVASPRAGSGWAVPLLEGVVPEFELLRRLNSRSASVDEFFATYVERRNVAAALPGVVVLPVYAVLGGGDKLVSQFSAAFGIPTEQRLYLDAGHRTIVKPGQNDMQLIEWLRRVVAERLEVRRQAARQLRHTAGRLVPRTADPRTPIVTRFMSGPAGLPWEEVYNEARSAATTTTVAVHDVRDMPDAEVDLLIAVHDAALVVAENPNVRATVLSARAEQDQHLSMSVGICPVGEDYKQAEKTVDRWLEASPPAMSFYVSGAKDTAGLRGVVARLLQLVIGRNPRRAIQSALAEQDHDELNDIYDDLGGGAF